jgi:hypothetical protein
MLPLISSRISSGVHRRRKRWKASGSSQKADDPFRDSFRDLDHRARTDALDAFAKLSKPRTQRKAGAASVTRDGVTVTFGQADHLTDTDRELAEFGARHGNA